MTDIDPDDLSTLRPKWLAELGHRGRVARTLIALVLTALGLLLPMPYVGYAYGLIVFAPAAVLLAFALGDAPHRRVLWLLGVPTGLGLVLSVSSFLGSLAGVDVIVWTLATTTLAALLGRPRSPA
jgi:hypothetical protein